MSIVHTGVGAVALAMASFASVSTLPARASNSPMRIIHVNARPATVTTKGVITFTVQVQGIRLNVKRIGTRPVTGEGHLQYYLDRIPGDAWTKVDYGQSYLMSVGTNVDIFGLKYSRLKFASGKHTVLVALAKNNGILYHVPIARVRISVR
jgi:hypothetical protein